MRYLSPPKVSSQGKVACLTSDRKWDHGAYGSHNPSQPVLKICSMRPWVETLGALATAALDPTGLSSHIAFIHASGK